MHLTVSTGTDKDGHVLPNADQHIIDQLSQDGEGQLGFSQLVADYGQEKS